MRRLENCRGYNINKVFDALQCIAISLALLTVFLCEGFYLAGFQSFKGLSYIQFQNSKLVRFIYISPTMPYKGRKQKEKVGLSEDLSFYQTFLHCQFQRDCWVRLKVRVRACPHQRPCFLTIFNHIQNYSQTFIAFIRLNL